MPSSARCFLPILSCASPGFLDEVERQLLVQALERASGNQTHAGQLLRINRDHVRYRIEKFGMKVWPVAIARHRLTGAGALSPCHRREPRAKPL